MSFHHLSLAHTTGTPHHRKATLYSVLLHCYINQGVHTQEGLVAGYFCQLGHFPPRGSALHFSVVHYRRILTSPLHSITNEWPNTHITSPLIGDTVLGMTLSWGFFKYVHVQLQYTPLTPSCKSWEPDRVSCPGEQYLSQ